MGLRFNRKLTINNRKSNGVNNVNLATTRLIGLAMFVATSFSGCGRSSAPETPPTAGTETVTFHVKDMGKRLALM
ncbi:MAG TPA: hypothetical protein VK137_16260 [Planctomycetaceae bacterium]|nr:hypothetical protein [Planctomycetaceae bacterium]